MGKGRLPQPVLEANAMKIIVNTYILASSKPVLPGEDHHVHNE
jgi:hypothetical protein